LDYCHFPPLPSKNFKKMNADSVFWLNFTEWASPTLNATVDAALLQQQSISSSSSSTDNDDNHNHKAVIHKKPMEEEFLLQLLEIYAQDQRRCNYSNYHPTIPTSTTTASDLANLKKYLLKPLPKQSQQQSPKTTTTTTTTAATVDARFVFTITAHQDLEQLKRLVQALHQPQHVFILHLERARTTPAAQFELAARTWARGFANKNVHVLSFGTIVYGTATASLSQWRILNWLCSRHGVGLFRGGGDDDEANGSFEYYIALDGASFPLWEAGQLSQQLMMAASSSTTTTTKENSNASSTTAATASLMSKVWLGPMLHKGKPPNPADSQLHLLRQKRLLYTTTTATKKKKKSMLALLSAAARARVSSDSATTEGAEDDIGKLALRLPRNLLAQQVVSPKIAQALTQKTHSGNTAVYHKSIVRALVESAQVRELFALSKYSAFCCLEERSWIAALTLALELPTATTTETTTKAERKSAVIQTYGGKIACESSKRNAVLSQNASLCYKVEDVAIVEHYTTATPTAHQPPMLYLNESANGYYLHGNRTFEILRQAKELGFLFARKFASHDKQSMDLLQQIQKTLW